MVTTVSELVSAAVSDRGLNESRPHNEDSFVELPQHGLFAVADGVGGAQAGEVASQMAVEILGEAFVNMGSSADPEDTMRIALERANEAIFQMSHDIPQLSSMATTVAAVHISGDMATIAHVGDSRVYRSDGGGRLFRETDDHSVVEEEVRAGRMTPEQALNHPSRNVISRALGAEDTVSPDIKCVLVHPATTFLLCSDGITRHIDDSEIEQLLNSEFGPDDICSRMKEICFERGAEDNLTAVVLRFPGERQLAPVEPDDDRDIEEVTLAGVREAVAEDAETDENIEIPAETYHASVDDDSDTADPEYLMVETTTEDLPVPERASPNTLDQQDARPPVATAAEQSVSGRASSDGVESAGVGFGRVLTVAASLIAGLILGAAASYFLLKPSPQQTEMPPPLVQQSSDISLTSFEKMRRDVDEDPVRYLNARAATPQEADEYFWLGRAHLLTGKPVEARREFEQARAKLATFDDRASARTMANEIAMALAIIDDPQAMAAFVREIEATRAGSGANVNANSAGNAALPVR